MPSCQLIDMDLLRRISFEWLKLSNPDKQSPSLSKPVGPPNGSNNVSNVIHTSFALRSLSSDLMT